MLAEYLDQCHRELDALAKVWMSFGAKTFILRQYDKVIASYPTSANDSQILITASDPQSTIEIHITGLTGPTWQAMAEAQVAWIARWYSTEHDIDGLTAALVETQDRLVALYEWTQAMRKKVSINEVLQLLVEETYRLLPCSGAFAVLRQQDQPMLVHQNSESHLSEPTIRDLASHHEAYSVQRFTENELPTGLHSVLLVVVNVRDNVIATLGAYQIQSGDFNTPEVKLAQAIVDQAGAQLENVLLYQEALARTRMETEMALARQVQMALLPQVIPAVPGLDIYGVSIPALQVGGDFFDVIVSMDKSVAFYFGDVTGKGMPAALMMAMIRTVARSVYRYMEVVDPVLIAQQLNRDLYEDFTNVGLFTTFLAGMVDVHTHKLIFTNAGHSPVIHAPAQSRPSLLVAQDMPIGIFDNQQYSSHTLEMQPGDVFVVASDGFVETTNQQAEMFGYDRFIDRIAYLAPQSARQIADALIQSVSEFADSRPAEDDRTILVIKAIG